MKHANSPAPSPAPAAGAVYLIANPLIRKSPAWPRIVADLQRRIKNARLVSFTDVFGDGAEYKTRWPLVVPQLAGAVVIPRIMGQHLMLSTVALNEATGIAAAGKPVLIQTRQGLFRWEQAEVRDHGPKTGRWHVELILGGDAR